MVLLMFAAEGVLMWSIVREGSVCCLLNFFYVALGAVVVRVGSMDTNKVVV